MSTPRRPLIAGNWKMNGLRADGRILASSLSDLMKDETDAVFDLAVCPPFTLIAAVGDALAGSAISLGAQDCHPVEKGAHTGDVSAAMLADLGCDFVIVGHSERRTNHQETDTAVQARATAVQVASCVRLATEILRLFWRSIFASRKIHSAVDVNKVVEQQ